MISARRKAKYYLPPIASQFWLNSMNFLTFGLLKLLLVRICLLTTRLSTGKEFFTSQRCKQSAKLLKK